MKNVKMKNKKGFVLGKAIVGLIIAGFAILILLGLGFKLFGIFIDTKGDISKAEGNMNQIIGLINMLENQGGGETAYPWLSPEGWAIIKWPAYKAKSSTSFLGSVSVKVEGMPGKCIEQNWEQCFCFCKYPGDKSFGLDDCSDNICYGGDFTEIKIERGRESTNDFRTLIKTDDLIQSGKELSISLNEGILEID